MNFEKSTRTYSSPVLNDMVQEMEASAAQDQTRLYGANIAADLSMKVAKNHQDGTYSLEDLSTAVDELNRIGLGQRSETFKGKLGRVDMEFNEDRLFHLLDGLARKSSFEEFKAKVEKLTYGLVFTAHPTFTMEKDGYMALTKLCQDDQGGHVPSFPVDMTLEDEFQSVLYVIGNARAAVERLTGAIFDVAVKSFPDHVEELTPGSVNIANWVGFDLDGRSDITWKSSFTKRLRLGINQCDYYQDYIQRHCADLDLDKVSAIFERKKKYFSDYLERLESEEFDLSDYEIGLEGGACPLQAISDALSSVKDYHMHRSLLVLRSMVSVFGDSAAKTHVRLNSSQIHNVMRGLIGIEREPDESSVRRAYLFRLNEKFGQLRSHDCSFQHLEFEPTTARRLFIMLSLFKKTIEQDEKIRFLIAETETSFTLLSALYLARFFGVEDNVEISPLFETDIALQKADQIIAELLANEHYRAYVKKAGKLCIQVGYSDAGRFVGQVSASMAIERLKIKLIELLSKEKLSHIDVVFFDTHGESVGRGGGQSQLGERINYFTPPYVRKLANAHAVGIIQETSFQGGDGFLFFDTEEFALASLTRFLEVLWAPDSNETDSFYNEEDVTLDFFLNLKAFHNSLIDEPSYADLLGVFAQNFLYKTGSRNIRRQHEGKADRKLGHPSQLRAIPHNAILQQLGYLANSVGGFGCAFKKNMDQMVDMYASSPRLRQLFQVAKDAGNLSNIDVLHAYISVLDPMIWLQQARVEDDRENRRKIRRLVRFLETGEGADSLRNIERLLFRDSLDFKRVQDNLDEKASVPVDALHMSRELLFLHVIRVGVMRQALVWAMAIPRFSNRPEISMDEVYEALVQCDYANALKALKLAFPMTPEGTNWLLEEGEENPYKHLHTEIFSKFEYADMLFKRITLGVANQCSAIG